MDTRVKWWVDNILGNVSRLMAKMTIKKYLEASYRKENESLSQSDNSEYS